VKCSRRSSVLPMRCATGSIRRPEGPNSETRKRLTDLPQLYFLPEPAVYLAFDAASGKVKYLCLSL
jgi:hypothetical protein